jgi:tetratricopeptide (TPR) repeat protein
VAKRKRPEDLSAYELYLLGIEHKHLMDQPDVEQAKRLFDEALAKDPKLARAFVGRAWTHDILTAFGPPYDLATGMAAAETDARSALALDPQDAEAYAVLGDALYNQGRFGESTAAYDRALTLNPSSADIATYAAYLAFLGQPERAAALADRALKLNPTYPAFYPYFLGPAYFLAGRWGDAVRILASVPPDQRNLLITVPLAGSYAMLGEQQAAAKAIDEARRADPSLSGETAVAALWKLSRDQERRLFLDALVKAGLPLCAPDSALASIKAGDRLPECEAERARLAAAGETR